MNPTSLSTTSNFADPDSAYRAIVEAHRGLDEGASAAFNARLVLILANHIGDPGVLREALDLARDPLGTGEGAPAIRR